MDLTLPVTYRGLTLTGAEGGPGGNNPISGFRLTRARYSEVSVHGYIEKKSLDDGMDASDVFLGVRSIELIGEVFAARKAGLFDALDLLRLKFTPTDAYNESSQQRGFLPLGFTQPTLLTAHWPLGVIDKVIYARPAGQPQHDIEFAAIAGISDSGHVVPFVARLEAKDPRFYNPVVTEEFLSGSSGSGDVKNRGNYPAPLNVLLFRTAAQTAEMTFVLNGMGTIMSVKVPAGTQDRVVRVDGVNKVVTLTVGNVETLRMDLITFDAGTTWPRVKPTPQEGETSVGYGWSGGTLSTGSRLFFSEAWI